MLKRFAAELYAVPMARVLVQALIDTVISSNAVTRVMVNVVMPVLPIEF